MEGVVKEIMKSVFEISNVSYETSPDTVGTWDSFRHMSLVVALEDEFDVEFDDNQIRTMTDLKAILNVLEELNVDKQMHL